MPPAQMSMNSTDMTIGMLVAFQMFAGLTTAIQERILVERVGNKPGSGRADGIAPVSPPTPPYVRFSAYGG